MLSIGRCEKKVCGQVVILLCIYPGWMRYPPQVFESRPQLSLNAAHILYLSGRFQSAVDMITQSEQFLGTLPVTPERTQMLALAGLYHGAIASVCGNIQDAIERTTFAQSQLSGENHLAHARGYFSLGLAYELSGQTEQAVQNYLLSSDEAHTAGILFLAIHCPLLCCAGAGCSRETASGSAELRTGYPVFRRESGLGPAWFGMVHSWRHST